MTRHAFKKIAKEILPDRLAQGLRSVVDPDVRARSRLQRHLINTRGRIVQAGPFAGMRYVDRAVGSEIVPKLLGTYELELLQTIGSLGSRYDLLVDVGAAEGYFAVGLLLASGVKRCIAFESDTRAHSLIRTMASDNGVADRIDIRGFCDARQLQTALAESDRPFLLCDCEGGELELLDTSRVPALLKTDVLVEVHGRREVPPGSYENHQAAMAALLKAKFAPTHHVEQIHQRRRTAGDWPGILNDLGSLVERLAAMDEHRADGPGWLWMRAGDAPEL